MPTIRHVAERAGVAPITVSRVINNAGYVSSEKRARVENAIAELGYVPNTLARSLRSRRTHTVALLLTDITNPFWTTVARGVEDAASTAGFSVVFCNTDESADKQERYLELLLQRQVDGIILAPASSSTAQLDAVMGQKVPLVIIDRRIPGVEVDTVYCDSEGGAYALVQLLISLGHRRIALLNGPSEVATAEDRLNGYVRALTAAGMEPDERLMFRGGFNLNSGYDMARQALTLVPRPTALFAANNFIAMGAIRATRDAGLAVPADVAIVTFDDLPEAMVIDPFLTAAAQPAYGMGRRATELLLARLTGEAPEAVQEVVLPVEIIVRRSSGPTLQSDQSQTQTTNSKWEA